MKFNYSHMCVDVVDVLEFVACESLSYGLPASSHSGNFSMALFHHPFVFSNVSVFCVVENDIENVSQAFEENWNMSEKGKHYLYEFQ